MEYPDDEPARCVRGCLEDLSRVSELGPPNIAKDEHIQIWLEAVRLLKQHFGDEVCIRGNCDQAPFSLASMIRAPQTWMMDLIDEATAALSAMVATSLGDSWFSSLIADGVIAGGNDERIHFADGFQILAVVIQR